MDRTDRIVVIASHLRPEEAGLMCGLLQSAGIVATVRDDMLSSVHPFLQPVIGGAKVAVPEVDEERAREILRAAGVIPGGPEGPPVEIPEEEWSRPEGSPQPAEPRSYSRPTALRRAVVAVPLLAILLLLAMRCVSGS